MARFAQPVPLFLALSGQVLRLRVRDARLQVNLSDRQNGIDGTLGGILDPEEVVEALRQVAASIDVAFCGPSSSFEGIEAQTRAASDILLDGTQDPSQVCNGISIGVGFSTRAAGKGDAVAPPVTPDPCD